MPLQGLLYGSIIGDGREQLGIDSFAWVSLLNDPKHAIVEMLIEVLRACESIVASRAHSWCCTGTVRRPLCVGVWRLLAGVWRRLFDTMDRREMSLEHVCSVEALLRSASTPRTEPTHHCAFVVCQGMPVLVILSREAFDVILAGRDRTLFRPRLLVRKHVCLEILEVTAAGGNWAETFVRIV